VAGSLGVIVIDHGSRRRESNAALLEAVKLFERMGRYDIVEPAHMELAEPSLQTAFDRCAARGAKLVVVQPYFLLPGKHWRDDIPRLAQAAAHRHPGISFLVAAPLGVHPLMSEIMHERISHCLAHAQGVAGEANTTDGANGA